MCSSKMKPRLRAEWMVLSEELPIRQSSTCASRVGLQSHICFNFRSIFSFGLDDFRYTTCKFFSHMIDINVRSSEWFQVYVPVEESTVTSIPRGPVAPVSPRSPGAPTHHVSKQHYNAVHKMSVCPRK